MNKKFFFSCFICILIFFLSSTFYFNTQTVIKSENRNITTFPQLPEKISTSKIKQYFRQLSEFYNDNFPHREKIILTLTALIPSIKNESISYDKVIIGKDDWIFLGNNYAKTIDKLTGKLYYHKSDNKKYDTATRYNHYKNIADTLLSQNSTLFFLIGPNKSTIYPEFLPKTIIPAPKPFHNELLQKMQEEGLHVYYPRQDILQVKDKALLYYVTDTHWNNYGAFIAFINLMPQLNPDYRNIIKEEDFSFKPVKSHAGDLIHIGNLTFKDKDYHDTFEIFYKNAPVLQPKSIFSSRELTPPILDYNNSNALTDKTLLVAGDSFTTALSPYFSLTFKNWYFIHRDDLHKISPEQLKAIKADYVIYECVERSL